MLKTNWIKIVRLQFLQNSMEVTKWYYSTSVLDTEINVKA